MRNVLANRPDLQRDQLARTRDLMNAHVWDCLVENYASLIDSLELPDRNDRHVLAAAIHAKANFIVTFNLKDFPHGKLKPYDIEAIHPDNFIMQLLNAEVETVRTAAERQWRSLKNPPKTLQEYLDALERNGLRETVENLKILLNDLG
jgi:predicted nucleic acid-binding protein